MGWWMLFSGFLWIVFWGTVVYLFVALVGTRHPDTHEKEDGPIEIAKRRYASGQLTRDEYERIRGDLAA
jgi:putative membrane protein